MTEGMPDRRRGRRWIPIDCLACGQAHGFTSGALEVLVMAAQDGEISTTKGNSVCLVDVAEARYDGKSVDRVVAFTRDIDEARRAVGAA